MNRSTTPENLTPVEPTSSPPLRLGDRLKQRGLITEEQLSEAPAHQKQHAQGKLLGQILMDLGYVSPADLTAVIAEAAGVPFAHLHPSMVQTNAMDALPGEFIEQRNLLPLAKHGQWLTVAAEDYTDVFLVEQIRDRSGCHVQIVAATADNIREVRDTVVDTPHRRVDEGRDATALFDDYAEEELKVVENSYDEVPDLEAAASDSPVIKLVNHVIRQGVDLKASDIHIEPDEHACRVRYRADGELEEGRRIPLRKRSRGHESNQNHGEDGYLRTPCAPGWSNYGHGGRTHRGTARFDHAHKVRRKRRHAYRR